jgi:hypothetical protein
MPYFSTTTPSSGNATQLQGRAVSPTGPALGAVLTFLGSGASGTWVPALGTPGPQGPAGRDGATWYSGPGAPSLAVGISGDWWLDTTNGRLYGPRTNNSWGSPLQLQSGPAGPTGERGATGQAGAAGAAGQSITGATGSRGASGAAGVRWYRGNGSPTANVGGDGDMYLDSTNVVLFGPKGSGSWPAGVVLRGPTGPAGSGGGGVGSVGPTGERGPTGPAGASGAAGAQGIQGERGATGERGPTGAGGAAGAPGLQGIQGIQGERGPTGERGAAGLDGQSITGPTGPAGAASTVTGPAGSAGATGPTGAAGTASLTAAQAGAINLAIYRFAR